MLIKELRQKRRLSQEQLAELCGLSNRTIQRAESGHRIGFASLRALAAEFNINVETLEQELSTMEKTSNEYKDLPLWLGSGWFTMSRKELKKLEILFVIASIGWLVFGGANALLHFSVVPALGTVVASLVLLAGAYFVSVMIQTGDKYDLWSRLEASIPKGFFGFSGKNIRSQR